MVSLLPKLLRYSIIFAAFFSLTCLGFHIDADSDQLLPLPSWLEHQELSCKPASSKFISITANCSAELALCSGSSKAYLKVATAVNRSQEQNVIVEINIPQECISLASQKPNQIDGDQTIWISQGVCHTPALLETKCTVDTQKMHLEVTAERKDNQKISQGFALALFIISILILVIEIGFILHKLLKKDRSKEDQRRSALEQFVSQQSQVSRQ